MDEQQRFITEIGNAAAHDFAYPPVTDEWAAATAARVGSAALEAVSRGIERGLVAVDGAKFRVVSLGERKGPYAWFSRSSHAVPAANWEYFVQVATWITVRDLVGPHLAVGFEDDLMDVTVRDGGRLLWCLEVKEKAAQLTGMLKALHTHSDGVDLEIPDRHNDPLRKAKYLVRARPPYFSLVATGRWDDFSVSYPGDASFVLTPVTREEIFSQLER